MIATKPTLSAIAADVYAGLTASPRRLPAKLFYDAAGSALFEEITRLPEYYLTRTEAAILRENTEDICGRAGADATVIELAAGSATKTMLLLAELQRQQPEVTYVPVDVSPAALLYAKRAITQRLPDINVQPVMSDWDDLAFLARYRSPRLVLFIGSTIGNLEEEDAVALLRRIGRYIQRSDRLLLGTDLVKDTAVLLPAYNDAEGVTARFNRNVLARINRELGGDFDLDCFGHVALWNAKQSRVEMHLQAHRKHNVSISDLGLRLSFATGERIHTENSYKYTLSRVRALLRRADFELEETWMDERQWYALHLARPA